MAPLANSSLGYFLLILCFISHQFHLITINASIPSKGFSLKLIHRDSIESPLYPGNLTDLEKMKRLVLFSESRALYLNSIVANYSSSTKNQTPIFHPDLIQPIVTPSMKSFIHLVQLGIGPSKPPYYLALDTGSDLIWTQCKHCDQSNCFPQLGRPTFDPARSETFNNLSCPHPLCTPPKYQCTNGKCTYHIQYMKGNSTGYLGTEKLTFDSKDKDESLTNIIFGCSVASHDLEFTGDIDGILGMNKGGVSLISQLGEESTHKQFSYCLIDKTKYPNAHSYLSFGSDIRLQGNVQSTPFVSLLQQPNLYGLKLLDISVANKRLNFRAGTFDELHRTGGCVIDSGSSTTRIAEEPYEVFKKAIINYFGSKFERIKPGKGVPDNLDLCFKIPRLTEFPEVTFHFAEGANLVMKPNTVFRFLRSLSTDQYGCFCLIILPNTKNKLTVIGELQQVDIRVQYDLSRQRLSWVPDDCHSHP